MRAPWMDLLGRDVDGFVQDVKAAIAAEMDPSPGYWMKDTLMALDPENRAFSVELARRLPRK